MNQFPEFPDFLQKFEPRTKRKKQEPDENVTRQTQPRKKKKAKRKKVWSKDEEDIFEEAVALHGENNVQSILQEFKGGVTKNQLKNHLGTRKTRQKRETHQDEEILIKIESSSASNDERKDYSKK